MGKRRKRAGAAEANKCNEEKKVSTVPTIMKPIEKKKRKIMSRKIMREKKKGKENWEIWT